MNRNNPIIKLGILATLLAMTVVMLGAYTRLKHSGLGCPDWPGCYGQLLVPNTPAALAKAQHAFPNANISPAKAWPEMIHRYFAGTLGLLILAIALVSIRRRKTHEKQPILVPTLLIGMLVFQALLGMWTVTLLLLPLVVMGHLLGGMTISSMLWWTTLRNIFLEKSRSNLTPTSLKWLRVFAVIGVAIIFGQIFLGGWTSANYAAVVCPEFPYCHGSFFPKMDFQHAFNLFSPIGKNYEGGVLNSTTRTTIQMVHRYGAFFTAFYMLTFGYVLTRFQSAQKCRRLGWLLISVVMMQFFLGIANIDTHLALPVAVAHNGVALTLLLSMIAIVHYLFYEEQIIESQYTNSSMA